MEPVGNWKFPRAVSAALPGEMFIYLKLLGGWIYVKDKFRVEQEEPSISILGVERNLKSFTWEYELSYMDELCYDNGVVMLPSER